MKKVYLCLIQVLLGLSMFFVVSCTSTRVPTAIYQDIANKGYPIAISSLQTYPPNFVSGIDVDIVFKNLSKKTIKYIYFTAIPYNKVGDIVESEIGGKIEASLAYTGPLRPEEETATHYDAIWYNSTIVYSKLIELNVIFMDNTEYTYSEKEISNLFAPQRERYVDMTKTFLWGSIIGGCVIGGIIGLSLSK